MFAVLCFPYETLPDMCSNRFIKSISRLCVHLRVVSHRLHTHTHTHTCSQQTQSLHLSGNQNTNG